MSVPGSEVKIREKSEQVFSELSNLVKQEMIELIENDFIEVANALSTYAVDIQENIVGKELTNAIALMQSAAKVMQDCDKLQSKFEPSSRETFNS